MSPAGVNLAGFFHSCKEDLIFPCIGGSFTTPGNCRNRELSGAVPWLDRSKDSVPEFNGIQIIDCRLQISLKELNPGD